MARRACTLLVAFATLVVAVALVLGAAKPANAQTFEQVAPELAQPDKVKTSSADAADAAAAKAAAAAALDRSLPVCATVETATTKPGKNNSNKSAACSLVRPVANDTADDPAWSQFEAAYAGTVWLPPTPAASKMHIRAAASYYQIAKLPLSRSTCPPGVTVAARLVLRLPATNGTKFTAGLLPKVNELAEARTVQRCVLAGVTGLATPQEAAAAAAASSVAAATAASSCTECNTLVAPLPSSSSSGDSISSGGYGRGVNDNVVCPSTPGVWYVDTLPLKVPPAVSGWCDDEAAAAAAAAEEEEGGGSRKKSTTQQQKVKERLPENEAYAAFVVSAGSEVDVAFFDIVRSAAAGSGAQSA